MSLSGMFGIARLHNDGIVRVYRRLDNDVRQDGQPLHHFCLTVKAKLPLGLCQYFDRECKGCRGTRVTQTGTHTGILLDQIQVSTGSIAAAAGSVVLIDIPGGQVGGQISSLFQTIFQPIGRWSGSILFDWCFWCRRGGWIHGFNRGIIRIFTVVEILVIGQSISLEDNSAAFPGRSGTVLAQTAPSLPNNTRESNLRVLFGFGQIVHNHIILFFFFFRVCGCFGLQGWHTGSRLDYIVIIIIITILL
mmetsp:Transcript_45897/g.111181  ORF Transcript_45897/g.111181 Transcript_45897/m.111181 type:complete len:248 (-) Transcript_45897:568-1311(-)